MKCQHCEKTAAFHITELTGDEQIQELHLCEDHARQYLSQGDTTTGTPPTLAGGIAQQVKIGQTAEELTRLDQQACPVCGITFFEFRNVGRLGCPHDYVCFESELEPLIVSIHGETNHIGKTPKRAAHVTKVQTSLIRLRREMKDAIEREEYERASEIRDRIKELQASQAEDAAAGEADET